MQEVVYTSKQRRNAVHTDVVVIGAGHSGLAMSQRLNQNGIEHVVLERGEVAQRWQHERWDSLSLLTPNWMFRLPGDEGIRPALAAEDPNGYLHKNQVAALLRNYSHAITAPVLTDVQVNAVSPCNEGYCVQTNRGDWYTRAVVLAVGGCDHSSVPGLASQMPTHLQQLTASAYRNPSQVRDGGVLVVGGSATGLQLAAELSNAGFKTTLSVGEHVRMPRTYNGRDIYWWLRESGVLAEGYTEVEDLERARRLPSPQLVGRKNTDMNLSSLQSQGVELVGRLVGLRGTLAQFSGSLTNLCQAADLKAKRLLRRFDEWADERCMDQDSRADDLEPSLVATPRMAIDLAKGEFSSVVWATGFKPDYSFLGLDLFDRKGRLAHDGGVTLLPGVYVLGLNLLRSRASSFIYGSTDDTAAIAESVISHLEQQTPKVRATLG